MELIQRNPAVKQAARERIQVKEKAKEEQNKTARVAAMSRKIKKAQATMEVEE